MASTTFSGKPEGTSRDADIAVRPFRAADREWADAVISAHQGSSRVARLGELLNPLELPGLVAESAGRRLGVLTYIVADEQFEVLTLHSRVEHAGAGSALLHAAAALARGRGCRRLWLCTTNDNLHALGFYQRRGLRLRALHPGAIDRDRALKPEIPQTNPVNRIPLRDLLELDMAL